MDGQEASPGGHQPPNLGSIRSIAALRAGCRSACPAFAAGLDLPTSRLWWSGNENRRPQDSRPGSLQAGRVHCFDLW